MFEYASRLYIVPFYRCAAHCVAILSRFMNMRFVLESINSQSQRVDCLCMQWVFLWCAVDDRYEPCCGRVYDRISNSVVLKMVLACQVLVYYRIKCSIKELCLSFVGQGDLLWQAAQILGGRPSLPKYVCVKNTACYKKKQTISADTTSFIVISDSPQK